MAAPCVPWWATRLPMPYTTHSPPTCSSGWTTWAWWPSSRSTSGDRDQPRAPAPAAGRRGRGCTRRPSGGPRRPRRPPAPGPGGVGQDPALVDEVGPPRLPAGRRDAVEPERVRQQRHPGARRRRRSVMRAASCGRAGRPGVGGCRRRRGRPACGRRPRRPGRRCGSTRSCRRRSPVVASAGHDLGRHGERRVAAERPAGGGDRRLEVADRQVGPAHQRFRTPASRGRKSWPPGLPAAAASARPAPTAAVWSSTSPVATSVNERGAGPAASPGGTSSCRGRRPAWPSGSASRAGGGPPPSRAERRRPAPAEHGGRRGHATSARRRRRGEPPVPPDRHWCSTAAGTRIRAMQVAIRRAGSVRRHGHRSPPQPQGPRPRRRRPARRSSTPARRRSSARSTTTTPTSC